jgi:outer membrane receptor protein involved in Fe transport
VNSYEIGYKGIIKEKLFIDAYAYYSRYQDFLATIGIGQSNTANPRKADLLSPFTWVDAQITYRPKNSKSVWRLGGTNLGNNYYRTGFGSPYVGGLYYISYGYNIF